MQRADNIPELPPLSGRAQDLFEKITGGDSLGASRNIRQINDLFDAVSNDESFSSGQALVAKLKAIGDYLIATRGKNTPAIGNAIRLLLLGLEEATSDVEEIRIRIAERRKQFNAESLRNRQLLAEYGANLLSEAETILAFDYSSTMMAILDEIADRGRQVTVIVPESRVLDGGRPIANEATAKGHRVVFILDMAFSHFLKDTDAILIGAETILANGDCWNTIGSYPIAAMANMLGIPYYVATELLKIDPRSFVGLTRPMKHDVFAELLDYPDTFKHPELISVSAPEMDNVPGSMITAYITPRGILLPEHIRFEALQFLESINAPVFATKSNNAQDNMEI